MLVHAQIKNQVSDFEEKWTEAKFCFIKNQRIGAMVKMFQVSNSGEIHQMMKLCFVGKQISIIHVSDYGSCFFLAVLGSIAGLRYVSEYLIDSSLELVGHEQLRNFFVDTLLADYNLILPNGQTVLEFFAYNNPNKVEEALIESLTFPVSFPPASQGEILLVDLFQQHCTELRHITTYADELCVAITPVLLGINLTICGNGGETWFYFPEETNPDNLTVNLVHEGGETEHYYGSIETAEFHKDRNHCRSCSEAGKLAIRRLTNLFVAVRSDLFNYALS